MNSRPREVTVWYRGIPYLLNLVICRRALVARQVEGILDSMESLAKAVGISRSTASRFFSGKPTSLAVTLKILQALHLTFDDVAQPVNEQDERLRVVGPDDGNLARNGAQPATDPRKPGDLDTAAVERRQA